MIIDPRQRIGVELHDAASEMQDGVDHRELVERPKGHAEASELHQRPGSRLDHVEELTAPVAHELGAQIVEIGNSFMPSDRSSLSHGGMVPVGRRLVSRGWRGGLSLRLCCRGEDNRRHTLGTACSSWAVVRSGRNVKSPQTGRSAIRRLWKVSGALRVARFENSRRYGLHIFIAEPLITFRSVVAVPAFELLEKARHAKRTQLSCQSLESSAPDLVECRHARFSHRKVSAIQVKGLLTRTSSLPAFRLAERTNLSSVVIRTSAPPRSALATCSAS